MCSQLLFILLVGVVNSYSAVDFESGRFHCIFIAWKKFVKGVERLFNARSMTFHRVDVTELSFLKHNNKRFQKNMMIVSVRNVLDIIQRLKHLSTSHWQNKFKRQKRIFSKQFSRIQPIITTHYLVALPCK